MIVKCNYYVIYSFDISKDMSVRAFHPPFIKRWQLTEDDDQYDYDYLGNEYENGKHRKYVALLDSKRFEKFIYHCNLHFEDVETMGSLTELGHLPAFCFRGESPDYPECISQFAYVTPMPIDEIEVSEEMWESFKETLKEKY